jgi:hypothetical protein
MLQQSNFQSFLVKNGNSISFTKQALSQAVDQKSIPFVVGEKIVGPLFEKLKTIASGIFINIRPVLKELDSFLQIPIVNAQYAQDKGQIAYFEGDCPEGWEEYTAARD